jgi:hypothetical protein
LIARGILQIAGSGKTIDKLEASRCVNFALFLAPHASPSVCLVLYRPATSPSRTFFPFLPSIAPSSLLPEIAQLPEKLSAEFGLARFPLSLSWRIGELSFRKFNFSPERN